jgi:hypothetical protein
MEEFLAQLDTARCPLLLHIFTSSSHLSNDCVWRMNVQSEGMRAEGDAQRYIDHAVNLRNTLRFLRRNEKTAVDGSDGGVGTLLDYVRFFDLC